MRQLMLIVVLLTSLTSLPCVVGCGGEETVAPEKMEENRKQAIERAKRMQEEMSKN